MDLRWSADERRFRVELCDFLDHQAPPEAEHGEIDVTTHVPEWARRWQASLFDHGWMVPSYPPHLGGRNATAVQTALYLEEMARRSLPRSLHFPGYGIAAPSLLQFGSPVQQSWAPPAIRGDTIWCIGMSEPDAGSDLASLRTRADVHLDRFVVTGQKVWTSYAPIADKCLCYVRTDPDQPRHAGISALIIEMDSPGVSLSPLRNMGGLSEFAEVFFDHVEVPADRLLGDLNDGWRVSQGSLGHERSSMWMEAVARLERVIDDLRTMGHRRGLSRDPLARQQITQAYEQVFCLRALGFRSMTGRGPQTLLMKLATSELYQDLLEIGLDLDGAAGTVTSGADERDWVGDVLRSVAGTLAGGTSEIQRDIIAQHALGLPKG